MELNTCMVGKLGETFSQENVFPDSIVENKRSHDLRLWIPFNSFKIEVKTSREALDGGWSFRLDRRFWQKRWSFHLFVCLDREYRLKRIYGLPRAVVKGMKSIYFAKDSPKKAVKREFERFRLI